MVDVIKVLVTLMGAIVIIVALYLLAIMPRMFGRPDKTPFLGALYAHRGLHDNEGDAPENSMAAFRKAVETGYGIELDVQLTKDKVAVVFHDATLKRVCGAEGKVSDFTFEELQKFSLLGSSEKIPRFEEVLVLVGGRVPLIIEYKAPGTDVEVCRVTDAFLQNYKGAYCIESFNPMVLVWYRRHRRDVMRGQLSTSYIKEQEKGYPGILLVMMHHLLFNFLTKPDFIAYNHKYYKDWSLRLCRYLYKCMSVAWTIRNQAEMDSRKRDFELFIFEGFIPKRM